MSVRLVFLRRLYIPAPASGCQAADTGRPSAEPSRAALVPLVTLLLVLVIGLVTVCAVRCWLRGVPVTAAVTPGQQVT